MRFITSVVSMIAAVHAAPEDERVSWLPNIGNIEGFDMYSGYLDITGTSKQLHYLFNASQSNPETDPLIIWFNGGPGCSSMLGWMQEHGPYQMPSGSDGMTFYANKYSWNNEANVLYLESPAGVGFSYCEGTADCSFNDDTSGDDNLTAVLAWFEKFPEFKANELFISGESYAGVYVPYLTYKIYEHNTDNADDDDVFKPNLQGFAVGNGVTNWEYDGDAAYVEMAYWHSLISQELHDSIEAESCSYSRNAIDDMTKECGKYFLEFSKNTSNVNVYDIYGTCWGAGDTPQASSPQLINARQHTRIPIDVYTPWRLNVTDDEAPLTDLPPCTWGSGLLDWLNLADTRKALHIPDYVQAWDLCVSSPGWSYESGAEASQWIYEKLQGKIRMLHYSGDTDGAVPTLGTQNWIASLNWEVEQDWTPYFVDAQVAGYTEVYEGGFTFGTVHGAGHMAPQFKPPQTYHLVLNWILGRDI